MQFVVTVEDSCDYGDDKDESGDRLWLSSGRNLRQVGRIAMKPYREVSNACV